MKILYSFVKYLILTLYILSINIYYSIAIRLFKFNEIIKKQKNIKKIYSGMHINIAHIVKVQKIISKIFPFSSCLIAALSLNNILLKNGYTSKIIIGIALVGGEFKSHAWLRAEEKYFLDLPEDNYKEILSF